MEKLLYRMKLRLDSMKDFAGQDAYRQGFLAGAAEMYDHAVNCSVVLELAEESEGELPPETEALIQRTGECED